MSGDTDDDQPRVLTVRVASADDVFDELTDRFASLDAGERPEETFQVVLTREDDLNRLLSPNNVALLRAVARERPGSIRATARLVGRDVRQVHENLSELARLNLLRFEEEGTAKRPVVWYDEIDVEVPISSGERSHAAA